MHTAVVMLAATAFLGTGSHDPEAYERPRQDGAAYSSVSLVAVLANPTAFNGKRVRVSGYLTLEFENAGLTIDKSHYNAALTTNALWVDPPKWLPRKEWALFNRRYATVEATVSAEQHGHMGAYSGALTHVRRIAPVFTEREYRKEQVRSTEAAIAAATPRALVPAITFAIVWSSIGLWRRRQRSGQP